MMFFVRSIVLSIVIYFVVAFGLILSQRPTKLEDDGGTLDFSNINTGEQPAELPLLETELRDGAATRSGYLEGPKGAPLLVLVHGSGWHGGQFDQIARQLNTTADVLSVNLRGHYNGAGTRGDVDYVGQLEDDLADLIAAYVKPDQRVVLTGHSSGGGLVVRFSGGTHRDLIDGAVLLAPFLSHKAPTTRQNSGGWARVLLRRVIGLSMLNTVGIQALDGLTMIQFNMPASVRNGTRGEQATLAYSWRLNQSYAPRADYRADIAALPPFLLIAGREDESFVPEAYEKLISAQTDQGRYHLLDGVGHLDVVDAPETAEAIIAFLK